MFTLTHPAIDIAIVCSDFKQSLHFYRDLLGLEEVLDIDIPALRPWGRGLRRVVFGRCGCVLVRRGSS